MRPITIVLAMALVLPWLAMPATAQTTAPPAPGTDISRQGGDLSDKLNSTDGVIRPQGGVDPAMRKAPPATGAMPVVPPPGTPGGRSDVVPK